MDRLPIGVCLLPIGVDWAWWSESARRLDEAGYAGIWCWDHFVSQGADKSRPVLEGWTTLTAAAMVTRRATVGTFVANVMNRHPAVLARMASTLQAVSAGRLVLGIGIGGAPAEHAAYGIDFPEPPERVERLEEAVAIIRALWTGGPVSFEGTHYRLADAWAHPRPEPVPPIIVGGETRAGARLAARIGDGWTSMGDAFARDMPAYLEALEQAGRDRAAMTAIVGFNPVRGQPLAASPWVTDPRGTWAEWRERGADGAIVTARDVADVDALVDAVARW